ncbi:MAG TPA: histidine kinase, partial [Bacteroidia bacterium]|nr:histidine kinase [Bacteroidia bacterium]
ALKYYLTAYRLFERDSVYNPRIHFYLGEMYLKMGNYKDAEYQSRLGVKKCKEFNHDYVIYNIYINLSKCLSQRNQIDSAKHLLNSTLQGLLKHTDENSISICYNALGELHLSCKEYDKALVNFENELKIQKKLNNSSGQQLAYLNLAYCSAHVNSANSAIINNYVNEAEKLFPAITKNDDLLLESYRKMAETNELIKNTSQSIKYYKLYYALRDTLMNKEKLRLVYDLQTKYETEKKERQIKSLEQSDYIKSLEIKKRNMYILIVMLLVVFVGVSAYLLLYKQRLKAKYDEEIAIKRTEEKERLRMAKDIHDDLGSGLSKINFLSELISRDKSQSKEVSENATSIAETAQRLVVNMRDLIWALDPENVTL